MLSPRIRPTRATVVLGAALALSALVGCSSTSSPATTTTTTCAGGTTGTSSSSAADSSSGNATGAAPVSPDASVFGCGTDPGSRGAVGGSTGDGSGTGSNSSGANSGGNTGGGTPGVSIPPGGNTPG